MNKSQKTILSLLGIVLFTIGGAALYHKLSLIEYIIKSGNYDNYKNLINKPVSWLKSWVKAIKENQKYFKYKNFTYDTKKGELLNKTNKYE